MRTIRANQQNDMVLNAAGNVAFASDLAAIAQCARSAAQAQLGEMIYAMDEGVRSFGTVWDQYLPAQFEASVRRAIMGVSGVIAVPALSSERVGDSLTYRAVISTVFGEGAVDGSI